MDWRRWCRLKKRTSTTPADALAFDLDGQPLTQRDIAKLEAEIQASRKQIEEDYRLDQKTLDMYFNI